MTITGHGDVTAANGYYVRPPILQSYEADNSSGPLLASLNWSRENNEFEDLYDIDGTRQCVDCNKHCCRQLCGAMSEICQFVKKSANRVNVGRFLRGLCTMNYLQRRFPIIGWLPKYRLPEFQGDMIAGVSVGMTVIPQALAYADIAGLPPQYGLYSAFIGCFVYVIFGTAKDVAVGPTAIMSLMTAEFALSPIPRDPTYAIVLCLFTGIVQIVMFIFGLGIIMDFISFPVLKAFTSAAAITIAMSQVKNWLGQESIPKDFLGEVYWTFGRLPNAKLYDFLLGLVCIIFIILFKKLKDIKWNKKYIEMNCCQKFLANFCWLIATARNIIVIVAATGLAAILYIKLNIKPFTLTGYIPPGIPQFTVPSFTLDANVTGNSTDGRIYSFSEMATTMSAGFIVVPIIGLVESMSVARAFGRRCNYKADPNQELLSFGISNILSSFVSAYPLSGTFSRSALNFQSGVKTPAGGIITGIIVLLALQFMTPLFYYIPKSALGVVIIMAVWDMITFHKVIVFWRTNKIDLLPWLVTFITCLALGLEYGIVIGVGLSLFLLVYPSTRPKLTVKKKTAFDTLTECKLKLQLGRWFVCCCVPAQSVVAVGVAV